MQDFQNREEQREALKQQIATAATRLLQDPEQNFEQLQFLVHVLHDSDQLVSYKFYFMVENCPMMNDRFWE